eukprot:scaffold10046_cov14-Tisochrysis_lutea.AAC.1
MPGPCLRPELGMRESVTALHETDFALRTRQMLIDQTRKPHRKENITQQASDTKPAALSSPQLIPGFFLALAPGLLAHTKPETTTKGPAKAKIITKGGCLISTRKRRCKTMHKSWTLHCIASRP